MALIRFFDLQNIAHQYRIQQGKIQPITGSKETLVEMGSEIKILVLETEKKKSDYKILEKPVTCSNLNNGKYANWICIFC